jgi:type I restriction enzyme, S subunit
MTIDNDKKTSLAKGWSEVKLEELGFTKAQSIKPADEPNEEFELWSVPSYPTNKPEIQLGKDIGSNKIIVQADDVLLCKINPRINRVWKVRYKKENKQIASTEWIVFRTGYVDSDFFRYRLMEPSFRQEICSNVSGVGGSLTRARPQIVKEVKVSIAPLPEQKRIAKKIETLQKRSKKVKQALETAKPLLDKLRQSILASAFRGDLTADWRKKHPDVEPASALLERIRVEHRKKWEENELAKMKAKDKEPKDNKWKLKYKEPKPIDTTDLPELPIGWCWARAEEICDFITKGTTPKKDKMFSGKGEIPFVKVYNLTFDGSIDFTIDPTFVERDTHENELSRSKVFPGDVLMNIVGPPLGKVSIVPNTYLEWNINQAIAIFRPLGGYSPSVLAHHLLRQSVVSSSVFLSKATAGQSNLTLEISRNILIPIIPLEEQHWLGKLLNMNLSITKKMDEGFNLSLKKIQKLDQSILSKAFRGELVTQDPSDESASVLLDRIKSEGKVVKTKKRIKRK